MRLGSLCSGAGGLDMAVEQVFGAKTEWHCETDPAASKVLAYRWPGVPNYGDLIATDWSAVEPIDVLCAGWPCQPFSVAGKQKGADDDRAIWPHIARAVRILRPRIIVLENVSAVLGTEFGRVADSLAALGYDIRWTCLRAGDIGAPHRRERLFIVATDTDDAARYGKWPCTEPRQGSQDAADSTRDGWNEGRPESARLVGGPNAAVSGAANVDLLPTPAAARSGRNQSPSPGAAIRPSPDMIGALLPTPTTQDGANCAGPSQFERNSMPLNVIATLLPTPGASDGSGGRAPSKSGGLRPSGAKRSVPLTDLPLLLPTPERWGRFSAAVARWESLTRPAPPPTEPNANGNPRLAAAFSEWMMGWPAGWVTDVPGISRNDQLRIIGNGVVPQCAAAALTWLLQIEVAA